MREVVDALDAAFYTAFENVEPTGKRLLLALDVSGSMTGGSVAGVPDLTPRDASAAMALVTAATEERVRDRRLLRRQARLEVAATASRRDFGATVSRRWRSRPRQRLDDAVKTVSDLPFGGTDCALPMLYALAQEREIDTFVIYTDSETWAGDVHPAQALREYRRASGIDARLVVVGMVSNGFSIADPSRSGNAGRRRFRHGDAAADRRLRPRLPSERGAPPARRRSSTKDAGQGRPRASEHDWDCRTALV